MKTVHSVLSAEDIKCRKLYLYFSKMKLSCIWYNQEGNKMYVKLGEVPKSALKKRYDFQG